MLLFGTICDRNRKTESELAVKLAPPRAVAFNLLWKLRTSLHIVLATQVYDRRYISQKIILVADNQLIGPY